VNGENLGDRLVRLAALAEPARRRLYDFVVGQMGPVSRDEAAAGVGVARHVAKFHLDRLVAGGLLDVEYRRPPGRGGPGAGRPAKLYRRSARTLEVSVPERRYDLAGRLLAEAVTQAERSGTPLAEALSEAARTAGFEPSLDPTGLTLRNCPFDALAKDYTDLVCGMNLDFMRGVVAGLGLPNAAVRLDPKPGLCCVRLITGERKPGGAAPVS